MSEELNQDPELELEANEEDETEEFEEISSDEVDRIVESLEALIESTTSENISTYLEEAMNNIFYLVYDEEEEEDDEESAEAA